MSEEAGKIVYRSGICTVMFLNEDEAAFYRGLQPGVSQTESMIRSVAEKDGFIYVLETTANGFNRIKVKL